MVERLVRDQEAVGSNPVSPMWQTCLGLYSEWVLFCLKIAFAIYEIANTSGRTLQHMFTVVGGTAPMGLWSFGERRSLPVI